jgi:PAS domain-containing protein
MGRLTYMNPIAEKLTGWAASDAHGKPLEEVMRIINEETHAQVSTTRAVHQGKPNPRRRLRPPGVAAQDSPAAGAKA